MPPNYNKLVLSGKTIIIFVYKMIGHFITTSRAHYYTRNNDTSTQRSVRFIITSLITLENLWFAVLRNTKITGVKQQDNTGQKVQNILPVSCFHSIEHTWLQCNLQRN